MEIKTAHRKRETSTETTMREQKKEYFHRRRVDEYIHTAQENVLGRFVERGVSDGDENERNCHTRVEGE